MPFGSVSWWEQPRLVRRLKFLEEGIAIEYALKSSSNTGGDFGSVSHGAGPVNGPCRQQHDNGGANNYDTGTHADADSGSHARDSASGGSRGGSDVVGRPD